MAEREVISLADGGVVTVLLARGVDCPAEFLHHPMVHVLDAKDFEPDDVGRCFPSNSKALITTQHLPKPFYDRLQMEMRRRRTNAIYRPTTGALEQFLSQVVGTSKRAVDLPSNGNGEESSPAPIGSLGDIATVKQGKIAPKGAIAKLVEEADPTRSTAEEARRLFRLAQSRGIQTTLGSVTQAITKYRRKGGLGARPASAVPQEINERLGALKALDDTIVQMETCVAQVKRLRDYVSKVDDDMEALKKKVEKAQALAQLVSELNA